MENADLASVARLLEEGGMKKEDAFAAASALAEQGAEKPADFALVDDAIAAAAAQAARLAPIAARKLVSICAGLRTPLSPAERPKPKAEEEQV